jgi:hypothetical protein
MLPSTGEKKVSLGQGWQGIPRQSTSREKENNSSSNEIRVEKKEKIHLHQQWNGGYAKKN